MTLYNMTANTKMNSTNVVRDFKKMQAVAIDTKGTIYAGGSFAFDTTFNYIARWDGSAWDAIGSENSIYENVPSVERCGFCGAGVQVVDVCPRCGGYPVRKREYKRGEFIVKLYQPGFWDKVRDVVKLCRQ